MAFKWPGIFRISHRTELGTQKVKQVSAKLYETHIDSGKKKQN
jgi:hypothetical protein